MKVLELHPSEVIVGERYRSDNDLTEEFLDSIRTKGILQPITITPDKTLVAGGRRLAACLHLHLAVIPCVVRDTEGELNLRECELIENLARKDFKWSDRIRLVNRIHELGVEKHGEKWSQQKSADLLERSVGLVNRQLQLSKALKQFPQLLGCKTEDEAVKLYRKLGEAVLVKHLVKQSEARASEESDAESEGVVLSVREGSATPDRIPLDAPIGVRLARNSSNSYRVGDALAGMDEILELNRTPNFSLIEVDPPYGIDLQESKKGDSAGLGVYNEVARDAYPQFLEDVCRRLNAITSTSNTRVIFWFGTEWYHAVYSALTSNGFMVDPIPGVWAKPSGQTASPDTYLARCYETFFIAWKGKPPIRQRGRSNVFDYSPVPAARKYHPTQRPLELAQELLCTFAYPGSIVFVPFLGSGSTLRAAYSCGMPAFGFDLEGSYKDSFIAQVEKDLEEGLYDEVEGADL